MLKAIITGISKVSAIVEALKLKKSNKQVVNSDLIDINENDNYDHFFQNEPQLGNESIYISCPPHRTNSTHMIQLNETKIKRNRRLFWKKKKSQRKRRRF